MISHFFDISKEKQDRILNAVLKVFAQNGYKRASTDEMVREASISKGLLFHYFSTKAYMYEFVYQYSIKYMTMELSPVLAGEETDYFQLKRRIEEVKYKVLKNFPYMPLFLAGAELEGEQQSEEVRAVREEWHEVLRRIEGRADFSFLAEWERTVVEESDDEQNASGDSGRPDKGQDAAGDSGRPDQERLCRLTDYMLEGILREAYAGGCPDADEVYTRAVGYLKMLEQVFRCKQFSGAEMPDTVES